MNFNGRIIKSNFIIKDKIGEDSISTIWNAYSIFSTKIYLVRFFNKGKFKIKLDRINNLESKLKEQPVYNYNIIYPDSFSKYEEYHFIAYEVVEGRTLYNFIKTVKKRSTRDIIKIITDLTDLIKLFHENDLTIGYFSLNDIWIESFYDSIQHVKFLFPKNNIINNFITVKEEESIKKYLFNINSNDKKENLKLCKRNDLIYIGILFYKLLTMDFDLKYFNPKNLEDSLKEIIKNDKNSNIYADTIGKILNKKSGYKKIDHLTEDFKNLNRASSYSFDNMQDKSVKKYQDIFEERREYFNRLEEERKRRLAQSKDETVYTSYNQKEEINKLREYNNKIFEERRFYFENNERERWNYLRKNDEIREKHIDSLIDKTKEYFSNIRKIDNKNELVDEHKKYFENLSDQIKNYADNLQNENQNYFTKLTEYKVQANDDEIYKEYKKYFDKLHLEAKEKIKKLTDESEKYIVNLADEARKNIDTDIYENKKSDEESKKSIDELLKEALDYLKEKRKDSFKYQDNIVKKIKKNIKKKKIKDIIKENLEYGIDIVKISILRKKMRWYRILLYIILKTIHKVKNIFLNNKK